MIFLMHILSFENNSSTYLCCYSYIYLYPDIYQQKYNSNFIIVWHIFIFRFASFENYAQISIMCQKNPKKGSRLIQKSIIELSVIQDTPWNLHPVTGLFDLMRLIIRQKTIYGLWCAVNTHRYNDISRLHPDFFDENR